MHALAPQRAGVYSERIYLTVWIYIMSSIVDAARTTESPSEAWCEKKNVEMPYQPHEQASEFCSQVLVATPHTFVLARAAATNVLRGGRGAYVFEGSLQWTHYR